MGWFVHQAAKFQSPKAEAQESCSVTFATLDCWKRVTRPAQIHKVEEESPALHRKNQKGLVTMFNLPHLVFCKYLPCFFGFMGLVPLFSCGNSESLKTMLPLLSCQNPPLNHFLVDYLWSKPYVHKEVSGREGGLGSAAACSALDLSRVAGFKTLLLPSP